MAKVKDQEMLTTINQYREAKATYQKLHGQAKKELLARFHELANELLQIQKELREDFATKVSIPTKAKTVRKSSKSVPMKPPVPAEPAVSNPVIARLQKRLAAQNEKLKQAQAAGTDLKMIKDRIYELEDELRLAKEKHG